MSYTSRCGRRQPTFIYPYVTHVISRTRPFHLFCVQHWKGGSGLGTRLRHCVFSSCWQSVVTGQSFLLEDTGISAIITTVMWSSKMISILLSQVIDLIDNSVSFKCRYSLIGLILNSTVRKGRILGDHRPDMEFVVPSLVHARSRRVWIQLPRCFYVSFVITCMPFSDAFRRHSGFKGQKVQEQ